MGRSYAGAFGVAQETTFGTPASPTVSLPITQENVKPKRTAVKRGGIYSSRQVQCQQPGLEKNDGSFTLEGDAIALGYPLKWLFGQVTSAPLGGTIALAATVTASGSGGSLAAAARQYRVANVFERLEDEAEHIGAASPLSTAVTNTGSTSSNSLAWINATPLAGYVLVGTYVYRQEASGECVRLARVSGSATSYIDDGTATPGRELPPEQAYIHTFTPPDVDDESDIPSFTITKNVDLPRAVQIDGCKIAGMTATVSEDGDAPVTFAFEVLGRRARKVMPFSPTYSPICAMLSWQSRVTVDGVVSEVAQAMTVVLTQNMTSKRSLNGKKYINKHEPGMLEATGSLTNDWADFEFFDRLIDGVKFDLLNRMEGPATTDKAAIRVDDNTLATPFPFSVEFHMPSCLLDGEGGGELNGGESMTESPNYSAGLSATHGYAIRARLVNRTPGY